MSLTNLLKNVGVGLALVSSLSCGTEISCNEGRRYVEGKGCVDDSKDAGSVDSFVEKDTYTLPKDTFIPQQDTYIPKEDTYVAPDIPKEKDTYIPPKDTYVCQKKEFFKDVDGDGFGSKFSQMLCEPEGKYTATNSKDCDDNDKNINPDSKEICDNKDNDCDSQTDENLSQSCKTDCGEGLEKCVAGEWKNCDADTTCEKLVVVCDKFFNLSLSKSSFYITSTTGFSWKKMKTIEKNEDSPSMSKDNKQFVYSAGKKVYIHDINSDISKELKGLPQECQDPDWSSYNKWVTVSCKNGNYNDLFVIKPDGTELSNVTNTPDLNEVEPEWSKQYSQIIYREGDGTIKKIQSNGGKSIILHKPGLYCLSPSWSKSGKILVSCRDKPLNNDADNVSLYFIENSKLQNIHNINSFELMSPVWSNNEDKMVFSYGLFNKPYQVWLLDLNNNKSFPLKNNPVSECHRADWFN